MKGDGDAAAPGRHEILLFVDTVEGAWARLLLGEEAFDVPAALLPAGTRPGQWLRASLTPASPPDDGGAALRAKLKKDDDGGDFKL